MSRALCARPAAHGAAVRPRSASSPRACELALAREVTPRPAGGCVPSGSAHPLLFFALSPRPIGDRQVWLAAGGSRRWWEPGTAAGTGKRRCFNGLVCGSRVPTLPRLRVMQSCARACGPPSLFLGTRELSLLQSAVQWLRRFPTRLPGARQAGTWEPSEGRGSSSGRLDGCGNKIGGGYAAPQRAAVDARRKFRASIAAGVDRVDELGARIRQPTRRGRNGGNPPFVAPLVRRVGRPVLEGARQAAEKAGDLGARLKLGRLRVRRPGELAAGELLGLGAIAAVSRRAPPGAPNADRDVPGMPALHGGGIWIEGRGAAGELAQATVSSGHVRDRSTARVGLSALTIDWRWGPGGAAAVGWAVNALQSAPNRKAGKRAGVNCPPAIARPHEAGGKLTLRRRHETVKGFGA